MNTLSFLQHTLLRGHYPVQFTLTYTAGANGSVVGASPQVVDAGNSGSPVTAVPNSGYHFVSWSDGVATAARTDFVDTIVTATFAVASVVQQGELLIAIYTILNPTGAIATFQAGPDIIAMELNGLDYRGVLWVECGDIAWTITVTGLTPITGVYRVAYTPLPGVQIYQGNAQLDATGITLEEHVSPDYARCSFALVGTLDPTVQIVVKSHGKRWHMIHRNDSANDDAETVGKHSSY